MTKIKAAALLLALLATPQDPNIAVSLSPTTATVEAGGPAIQFQATVQNDPTNAGVHWRLTNEYGNDCSPACGTITQGGLYTPPAAVPVSPAPPTNLIDNIP